MFTSISAGVGNLPHLSAFFITKLPNFFIYLLYSKCKGHGHFNIEIVCMYM